MEPMMKDKKEYTSFVPIRMSERGLEFYLQKRDLKPVNNPGKFAEFGGHVESGEEIELSLKRELKEELNYAPQQAVYFSRFELPNSIVHVFYEQVGEDFESRVTVLEGEYGRFLALDEVLYSPNVSLLTQIIALSLSKEFSK